MIFLIKANLKKLNDKQIPHPLHAGFFTPKIHIQSKNKENLKNNSNKLNFLLTLNLRYLKLITSKQINLSKQVDSSLKISKVGFS